MCTVCWCGCKFGLKHNVCACSVFSLTQVMLHVHLLILHVHKQYMVALNNAHTHALAAVGHTCLVCLEQFLTLSVSIVLLVGRHTDVLFVP